MKTDTPETPSVDCSFETIDYYHHPIEAGPFEGNPWLDKVTGWFEDLEEMARAFHESHEKLAPLFGFRSWDSKATPWEEVPAQKKAHIRETLCRLLGPVIQKTRRTQA